MNKYTAEIYNTSVYQLTKKGEKRLAYLKRTKSYGKELVDSDERDCLENLKYFLNDLEPPDLRLLISMGYAERGPSIRSVIRKISSRSPDIGYVLDTYVRFACKEDIPDKEIDSCLKKLKTLGYGQQSESDQRLKCYTGIDYLTEKYSPRIAFDTTMSCLHHLGTKADLGYKTALPYNTRKSLGPDITKVLYILNYNGPGSGLDKIDL